MSVGRDNVRGRLQAAALELYRERGYDRTTTAEIASRAGVTERTYFRHFPDKREVLFNGEAAFHLALSSGIDEAPETMKAMAAMLRAFQSIQPMLEDNRPFSEAAHEVIALTPALRERQLAKTASTTSVVSSALQRRGMDPHVATLAAGTGMALFGHAVRAWFEDPSTSLGIYLNRAFEALHELAGSGLPGAP